MQSKTTMEAEAAATQRRMDSANALLSALAGEEGRWTQQSQAFDSTIQRLTGQPSPELDISPVFHLLPKQMRFMPRNPFLCEKITTEDVLKAV